MRRVTVGIIIFLITVISCRQSEGDSRAINANGEPMLADETHLLMVEPSDDAGSAEPIVEVAANAFGYFPVAGSFVVREGDTMTWFFDTIWQEMNVDDIVLTESGYYETTIMGQDFFTLFGGNFLQLFSTEINAHNPNALWILEPATEGNEPHRIYSFGVESISAHSILSEDVNGEEVVYGPQLLRSIFFGDQISMYWNALHNPWVEGEEGPGIGVTLDITFEEPSDHMLVLNGFVDPERRHLFRMNNRVRTAMIRSTDPETRFEFEYTFEDVVELSYINFPTPTRSVQLEILDVYPGSRWDDTAISAIIRNHTWERPIERLERTVRAWKVPENQYREAE